MTVFKSISGHTNLLKTKEYMYLGKGDVREYFAGKGGDRCLAKDFLNLACNDPENNWDKTMDDTRNAMGNGAGKFGSKRVRTYQHFIISPNPKDKCNLELLRKLALRWCEYNFGLDTGIHGTYECAIFYHDDNSERVKKGRPGIPHAHVIVNNTNLLTGKRLQLSNKQNHDLARDLEKISRELGLSYFSIERVEGEDGKVIYERKINTPRLDKDERVTDFYKEHIPGKERKYDSRPSKQNIYRTKVEREMRAKGETPWKDELRQIIDIACNLSYNMEEFRANLEKMGVYTEERKRKNDNKHDLIFHYPQEDVSLEKNKRKVGGERLGRHYTNPAIQGKMRLAYYQKLSANDRDPDSVINLVKEVNVVTIKKGADVALVDISRAFAAINGDKINTVEEAKKLLAYAKSTLASHEGKSNYQSYVNQIRNLEALIKVANVTNILPPSSRYAATPPKDIKRQREMRDARKSGKKVDINFKVDHGWELTKEEREELKKNSPSKFRRWLRNYDLASQGRTRDMSTGSSGKKKSGSDESSRRHSNSGDSRSRSR